MIHVLLILLGLLGLCRAIYCAWRMDIGSAGVLRRVSNASMGAVSVALLWAGWVGPR